MSTRPFALALASLAASMACTAHDSDRRGGDTTPVPVEAARVELGDWPIVVEAGGVVRAAATAAIASRVLAPVAAVHVRAGDRVRRGQTLIDLDVAELHAQAAGSASSLRAAELAARAAAAESAGADAALTLARATHARIRRLHEQRSATDQELDQAAAGLTAAEARLAAARAQEAGAGAALEAARAAADAGGIVAAYGRLVSPFDGVVVDRRIDPGAMAVPGAALLVVEDAAAARLHVQLDATRAAALRPGAPAEIQVDADGAGAAWLPGRVVEIARIDPASQSFDVRIDALDAAPAWRSGLFGRARFRTGSRSALGVPAAAVLRRGQLTLAFVVADARARLRAIRIGDTVGDRVEVLAGLVHGDQVVVNPPPGLEDGAAIVVGGTR